MNEQKLHVTGNGTAHVSPDTICLTITIEGRCHDYGEALDKTAEKTDALKDLIEKLGFPRKDLKTVFVHITTRYEDYEYRGKTKKRLAGYDYEHKFHLLLPIDNALLAKTLTELANCSVKPSFDLSFTVRNPGAARDAVLENAVRDATSKAKVLAAASGCVLGDITGISNMGYNDDDFSWHSMNILSSRPQPLYRRVPDVEPEDFVLTAKVDIYWELNSSPSAQ